ncbi:nucleoside hydrolase [Kibdelosporangium phytohabitans]|uniref:Nucleoside hydrolase n=1 Tax=Kibdelosporangium phytohabitans TaxID=860235 RepID=A0A0N7F5G1_9PSEU|nr:nucleoside hydrolase [Kibdelosporangium phytohabitans]ALG14135.1 nucleoside hydrolase [Kibdelosporangium phytohabitans]MBE1466879.1 purine nucleosidase [Kibdelosporangium phytohabitans]
MRIILDTDPGIDDSLAILFLAAQENMEIVAVGSVHGNVPAPTAADNALQVLDLAGLTEVPVAIGAARPLAQELRTTEFVHGADGLGGQAGKPPARKPEKISAAEQIVHLARENPGELTLLALGPLTNVALALLLEPRLPHLLKSVMILGGALGVPGNVTPNAEANIWHDPEAADLVFEAGFENLTLVGLDVTETAKADEAWLTALAEIPTPKAQFATALLKHYADFYSRMSGYRTCTIHDPLAAALLQDPTMAEYKEVVVSVELRGTHTRGQLISDWRRIADDTNIKSQAGQGRKPIRAAVSVNTNAYLTRLSNALR